MTKREMCEKIIASYNSRFNDGSLIIYKIESRWIYYCEMPGDGEIKYDNVPEINKSTFSEFIEEYL